MITLIELVLAILKIKLKIVSRMERIINLRKRLTIYYLIIYFCMIQLNFLNF